MKITPEVIAKLTGGTIEGDRSVDISGLAKIEEAKEGDISFIANPKYAHFATSTKASVLIVPNDFEAPEGIKATLVRVADPYSSLALLMKSLVKKDSKCGIEQPSHVGEAVEMGSGVYIGAFAYIGDGVKLGDNVKIYPGAVIGDRVEIGDNTTVYSNASIYEGCRIGKDCILHSGCVIGADGFGFAPMGEEYSKIPQIGIVVIEDNVEVGANTTIDRATMGATVVGRGTKLDNLIHIAHNVAIGSNNVMAAQTGIAGSTRIGNSNRIGGQVGIAGHIKFGNCCEIGAQSGIHKGFGDNKRVIGYPATDLETFAKSSVLIKRLPELYKELEEIRKIVYKDNKQ